MSPTGFIYLADIYCPACAADLPDRDPEGNRKGPFYSIQETDAPCTCGRCGAFVLSTLTDHGGRELAALIREANERFPEPLPGHLAEWADAFRFASGVRDALAEREDLDLIPETLVRGSVYRLTTPQRLSLARLARRWDVALPDLVAGICPEVGNPETACLMAPIPGKGIVYGVERDGYCHT